MGPPVDFLIFLFRSIVYPLAGKMPVRFSENGAIIYASSGTHRQKYKHKEALL
jgi:hypothetical protein